jgi:hypothetical protein
MDNELQKYFMKETNKKFEDLQKDISSIQAQLSDLRSFKVAMMVSSRWVSLIISAVCGLATLLTSAWISAKVAGQ